MLKAGIDFGYGNLKAVTLTDGLERRSIVIPSMIVRAVGSGALAKQTGAVQPKYRVSIDGEDYFVGESALLNGGTRSWQSDASDRPNYARMVLAALGILGVEGPVAVGLGIPLSAFAVDAAQVAEERRALRRLIRGTSAMVTVGAQKPRRIEVADVTIFPQGYGAYVHALLSLIGGKIAKQSVGLVDVGFRTSDYLLMQANDGKPAVVVEAMSGSIDVGVGRATEAVQTYLATAIGSKFPAPEGQVQQALNGSGIVTIQGREINLRPTHEAALKAVASEIESHLRREWGAQVDYLAAVIAAGGGGEALAKHLNLPGLIVVPDSMLANAMGYVRLLAQKELKQEMKSATSLT